jgi:CheY-like chemotaxis protein
MVEKNLHVLIVDDSKHDQHLVAELFKRSFPCAITTASSLTVAKEKILIQKFDIISLDGMLPCLQDGGLGYKLIPFIQQYQKHTPVIVMISGEQVHITTGLQMGAHFGFGKKAITKECKLNEKFTLIPIVTDQVA